MTPRDLDLPPFRRKTLANRSRLAFLVASLLVLFPPWASAQTPLSPPASSTLPPAPTAPPSRLSAPPSAPAEPFFSLCQTILLTYSANLDRLQATALERRYPNPSWQALLSSILRTETDFRGCFRSNLGQALLHRRKSVESIHRHTSASAKQENLTRLKKRQEARMLKEEPWKASRFFWSIELGGFFHTFQPFNPNPPTFRAYDFIGGTLGGRWGYATGNILITGDISYGAGDERFMVQLGGTFGILLHPSLILDFGSGIHFLFLSQGMDDPEVRVPLDIGLTARFKLGSLALGLRTVASSAFDVSRGGISLSLRLLLTLGSF